MDPSFLGMRVTEGDDFFILEESAFVDAWSPGLGSALKQTGATLLRLRDWQHENLSALVPYSECVTQVHVECEIPDLSALAELPHLEALYLRAALSTIDFSRTASLTTVGYSGDNPDFGNLREAQSLRELKITGTKMPDLEPLSALTRLESLIIREASLKSLKGIAGLRSLRRLVLAQLRLESLEGLRHASELTEIHLAFLRIPSLAELTLLSRLTSLSVWSCRKVTDVECVGELVQLEDLELGSIGPLPPLGFLGALKNLKSLRLESVGRIPSLQFLRELPQLEEFLPVDKTIVEDGDLSVLLELPSLKKVVFTERRHYSHRRDDIRAVLSVRSGTGG